ncbi:uncharacterized protein AMSG_01843 [Thecamonas trahens ATCC 50062]|uniref:Uncharacterized protein n=1 Tax=Thecamonas trahens ATCC 50062 TaxID=461836 RepID=A0A0L0DVP0_THETB|nr:hypothetical protein AMSG_01843 [Thecamonas trahens ATCC 50062]KNC55578.1 hypothetical protein AMSG_01843 [Thecamonas trahens ATCC 50062]|eukprot:XP_013761352.1 hypothetical protein AMSG_01843 [Thecamonas trahens ATCC 50062]
MPHWCHECAAAVAVDAAGACLVCSSDFTEVIDPDDPPEGYASPSAPHPDAHSHPNPLLPLLPPRDIPASPATMPPDFYAHVLQSMTSALQAMAQPPSPGSVPPPAPAAPSSESSSSAPPPSAASSSPPPPSSSAPGLAPAVGMVSVGPGGQPAVTRVVRTTSGACRALPEPRGSRLSLRSLGK